MPKLKTHKGARARVKVTGTGKLKANKAGKRHLNIKLSGKKVRQRRGHFVLDEANKKLAKRYFPYADK